MVQWLRLCTHNAGGQVQTLVRELDPTCCNENISHAAVKISSVATKTWHSQINKYIFLKHEGLPWWLSGKESTCQHRKHGFDPSPGKIPHAMEQLSPCTTTVCSRAQELQLQSPRAAATEAVCPRACALQQEKIPP